MGIGVPADFTWRSPENLRGGDLFFRVTFTTLGYGDITLVEHDWRLLSGIEALNGILLVGWTTAFLFMVVQRSWTTKAHGQDGK